MISTSPATAGTISVSNTNDTGAGSLRQAITTANANSGADIIKVDVTRTIQLSNPLPLSQGELQIVVRGANLLSVRRNSVQDFRIFTSTRQTAIWFGKSFSTRFYGPPVSSGWQLISP